MSEPSSAASTYCIRPRTSEPSLSMSTMTGLYVALQLCAATGASATPSASVATSAAAAEEGTPRIFGDRGSTDRCCPRPRERNEKTPEGEPARGARLASVRATAARRPRATKASGGSRARRRRERECRGRWWEHRPTV